MWGQTWFIDGGRRLGNSFTAFEDRYFTTYTTDDGYSKMKPLPSSKVLIEDKIRDVCMTIEAKDYFDLPPLIESNIMVDLPPAARKQYLEMEKDFFTFIEQHPVEAFNNSSQSNKLRQFAGGAAYINDKHDWALVHDAKMEALRSVIEEANGMPVLVAYQFVSERERILAAFPRARPVSTPGFNDAWNKGDIPIGVGHPASVGHGLNLQYGSNIMCDFSSGWNLEEDEQIIERIGPTRQAQAGLNRPVYRRRIVARDTVEENVVLPVLAGKASLQGAFKEAMKRRRN